MIRIVFLFTMVAVHAYGAAYVTCDLRGGLGNQLFQIATTLSYAWDYGVTPVFPDLNRLEIRVSGNKERIFFRLNTHENPTFATFYSESNWHSSEMIPFQANQKLFGYFQSWKRFDHHRGQIFSIFSPSSDLLASLCKKYADLISNPKTVALHVRTFTFNLHHSKLHPFLGLEYYKKAIACFPPDALFVVFSDRIHWCEKHFPNLKRQFVFIQGNDPIEEFFLMSMMKHNVIANSTFSWWAAYLNQNPEKIVIAPTSWMHPDHYPFPLKQPNEFYLPDWELISPNYFEPYPEDITWYDKTIDDSIF
jgi:Glycosyl transferase family 11